MAGAKGHGQALEMREELAEATVAASQKSWGVSCTFPYFIHVSGPLRGKADGKVLKSA
jgi:hypothetical protein